MKTNSESFKMNYSFYNRKQPFAGICPFLHPKQNIGENIFFIT